MYLKNTYAVKAWKEDTEVQDGNCLRFRILLLNGQSCSLSAQASVSWRGCAAGMGGALCVSLAEFSVFAELFILGSAVS